MKAYLKLLRPHQYVKNLLIFFPIFFDLKINDFNLLMNAAVAFISFCLAASTIYIFNDIRDIDKDREHPEKRRRPIASGAVSIKKAWIIDAVLLLLSFSAASFAGLKMIVIVAAYLMINLVYSLGMKNIAILDVFSISTGFLLRLISGTELGAVPGVVPSHWIIIMTFLLSLFLGVAKRRDDLLLAESGVSVRKSISGYSLEFVNSVMSMMCAVIIVSYLLYTLDPDTVAHFNSHYIYFTTFFVILGLLRYLQITFVHQKSGSPTEIVLKDRFLQLALVAWVVSFAVFAY